MQLTYKNNLFYLDCGPTGSSVAKRVGFSYDPYERMWVTSYAAIAWKVCTDKSMEKIIKQVKAEEEQAILDSYLSSSDIEVPCPDGLKYLPYQLAGIQYMCARKSVLLADQMGLGKTIQAIGLCNLKNAEKRLKSILVICPASLKINWRKEWNKWSTLNLSVGIVSGSKWKSTEVVIINYDILAKNRDNIRRRKWDVIILDECHYLKNLAARRTKEVVDRKAPLEGDIKIALTGTPISNRPIELYPILRYLDPAGWPNKMSYGKRYCGADFNGYGWDFSGSSNLEELQRRIRSKVMVRRLKQDVLQDLPEKVRQVIEIEPDKNAKKILRKENEVLGIKDINNADLKDVVHNLYVGGMGDDHIATIRKEVGISKVPMVVDHIKECLESGIKIVCFAYHKEVIRLIHEAFKDISAVITGDTPMSKRNSIVENFQNGSDIKLFIGNMQAAGVGITLTASSHVIFAELEWVPGTMSQAEDRCHRIGQHDSVLVQHLVFNGSVDALMAKGLVIKQEVIDKSLDFDMSFME